MSSGIEFCKASTRTGREFSVICVTTKTQQKLTQLIHDRRDCSDLHAFPLIDGDLKILDRRQIINRQFAFHLQRFALLFLVRTVVIGVTVRLNWFPDFLLNHFDVFFFLGVAAAAGARIARGFSVNAVGDLIFIVFVAVRSAVLCQQRQRICLFSDCCVEELADVDNLLRRFDLKIF